MSDHKGPLPFVEESAKKTKFDGLFNVVLRQLLHVVGFVFIHSTDFVPWIENRWSAGIDAMDPISISSDDSLLREIDEYKDESPLCDTAASSNFGAPKFEDTATSSNSGVFSQSSLAVNGGLNLVTSNGGGSSNFNPPSHLKSKVHGTSSGNSGALQSHIARDSNSEYNANNDYDGPPSKRPKRTLPSSFQASSRNAKRKILAENAHGTSYHSARPSSTNSLNNPAGRGNEEDVVMLENKGSRLLPPSLFHGRLASSNFYANSSGPSHYMGNENDVIMHESKGISMFPPSSVNGRSASSNIYANPSGPSHHRSENKSSRHFSSNYYFGGGGNDDGAVMDDNRGNRALPPSLGYGRTAPSNSYGNSSGPSHIMGVFEGVPGGTDERILFQAAVKDLNERTHETNIPNGILSVALLRHQKIALAWMIEKEEKGGVCVGGILADDQGLGKTISMIALIQMQRTLQEEYKSEDVSTVKAEALNLEDDEDENVASAPAELKPEVQSDVMEEISKTSTSRGKFYNKKPAAGTLVICPASVLRQWARELDEKVTEESKLSVLMYHGSNRTRDPIELAKYDAVLTTYSIVTMEVPKQPLVDEEDNDQNFEEKYGLSSEFSSDKKLKKTSGNKKARKGKKGTQSDASDCGALANVRWFRIILDEAQTIKNHRTQVARACCRLRSKRRWCLSGTPIQNSIDELFSYFRFLRHDPYSNYKKFVLGIRLAILRDPTRGYKRLQCVLKGTMLRRTKGTLLDGKPIITLPPKTTNLTKVDFSAEERAFYNKLEADSRSEFKAYAAAGTVNQNYANIRLMLLRLRQACDHPLLVKGFSSDSVGKESSKTAKSLPTSKLTSLLRLLETSLAICGVCNDPPENAVVTSCEHVFCYQCVSDYLTGEDTTCPESGCREQVSADVIFTRSTIKKCLSDDFAGDLSSSSKYDEKSTHPTNKCSSKIKAALQILQSYCKPCSPSSDIEELRHTDGYTSSGSGCTGSQITKPTKALVFSQWTSMLDLVEDSLGDSGLDYRRLDGTMSLAARDEAVKDFNTKPEVTVMLMSLKAGNLGLNMVAACHVILLDLWWNPTTEDQAVDRAHRIGQTRPVTVTRLTIRDTVEDRILALQEEKRKMVASAFGEDKSGAFAARLTMEDLAHLFDVR